jgi:hypothetical protein
VKQVARALFHRNCSLAGFAPTRILKRMRQNRRWFSYGIARLATRDGLEVGTICCGPPATRVRR